MSSKIYIKDLGNHIGETVTLQGWLFNKRSSGKVKFLILRDGTGYLQCIVFKGNVSEEVFNSAENISQESSFSVTGLVKEEKRAIGGFELDAVDLKMIGESNEYPITPKEHGIEFLIDHRHLWIRSKKQAEGGSSFLTDMGIMMSGLSDSRDNGQSLIFLKRRCHPMTICFGS